MSKIYKNSYAKKRVPELSEMCGSQNFSYYLLVSLFVSSDSISRVLKENNCVFIAVFQLISPDVYLESNRTSITECFCENS